MDNHLHARDLAKRVVRLIKDKERKGPQDALLLLNAFYGGRQRQVARAYELACLVALKQLNEENRFLETRIVPDADWLALKAAQAIREGKLMDSFHLLKMANTAGARGDICRSVVFQLLRNIDNSERVTELCYTPTAVTSIEIGRVRGVGLIILMNAPSVRRMTDSRNSKTKQSDCAAIFLRNLSELSTDTSRGHLEFRRTGNNRAGLGRIDWTKYLRRLCFEQPSQFPSMISVVA